MVIVMQKSIFMQTDPPSLSPQGWFIRILRLLSAGLAYFLLARFSLNFVYPFGNIATIWPPSGLALGLLLVCRPSNRGLLLLTLFAANTFANLIGGNTLANCVGFAAVNSFETFLCTSLLYQFFRDSIFNHSIKKGIYQIITVTLGVVAAAVIGAGFAALALKASFWNAWVTWCIADGAGIVVVTPFILAWAGYTIPRKKWKWLRLAEGTLVIVLFISALTIELFAVQEPFGFTQLGVYFLGLIFVWAAARFDKRYITVFFMIAAGIIIWTTVHGLGYFAEGNIEMPSAILSAQIFLGAAAISMHVLNDGVAKFQGKSLSLRKEITRRLIAEDQLLSANLELQQRIEDIALFDENMQNQANHDMLTGLHNRRYLIETVGLEIAIALRGRRPLSVLLLDIDHFKAINDTYGHNGGDEVLVRLGELLRSDVREGDIVCRYGGEEFVVVMVDASKEDVCARAEAIRSMVSEMRIPFGGSVLAVTCSVGVAALPTSGGSWDQLISKADEAMYRAKQAGRNRVVLANSD